MTAIRKAPMQHHEGGYYIRLLARDRPGTAATIARRLAQQKISLESIVQRHAAGSRGAAKPGRSNEAVPVIMITYATSEDAVRKALAAVRRDRVVYGTAAGHPDRKNLKPQHLSLEICRMSSKPGKPHQTLERALSLEIVRVTERAAVAAARLRGRGAEKQSDQAAVDAMRRELAGLAIDGTVVIGEGEMDEAPMLFIGEKVGPNRVPRSTSPSIRWRARRSAPRTCPAPSLRSPWREDGTLLHAPDIYMDKIAIGPGYPIGVVDLDAPADHNIIALAKAKGSRRRQSRRWCSTGRAMPT